ncbi:MAG TPA: alcohol dehydrogenase catalytic domain-containing protein [Blastocatellia bacterium]|nr:alcohol dehydrogenase catalytic domain-containing protein [Blastocatellia bacterium]
MKALRFESELKLVRDQPVPRREGEALVQVICAGICNTDLEIVKGYGDFHGTLGHEFVGRVVESPDASLVGRRVVGEINAGCGSCELCLQGDSRHCADRTVLGIKNREGAFAEFLSLPARNLLEVPDSVSDEAAVFIEPLAAACNILEQITLPSSCHAAVVGDGKLAQLVALVFAQIGSPLTVIGRHKRKLEMALSFGANRVVLDEPAMKRDWRARFDLVVEASGSPSGLGTALALVKPRGTIVLKTTHHQTTPLDISQVVVNELTIVGSRCGRFRPALDMAVRGSLDLSALISREYPLEEGLRAFEEAAAPETMKIVLQVE